MRRVEGENRQKEGAQTEELTRPAFLRRSDKMCYCYEGCAQCLLQVLILTLGSRWIRGFGLGRLFLWLEVEMMRNCRRLREFVLRSAFLSRLHRTIVSSPGPPRGAAQVHMHVTWFSHTESPTPCQNNNYISHESLRNQTALI